MTLKISISGVRGIYGDTLTDDIVKKFGIAYSRFVNGGTVLVGSDTRRSGAKVKEALFRGLRFDGRAKIIDIGFLPTPTVQVITRTMNVDGAVIVTASHNPSPWNGLKFVRPDGIFLPTDEAQKLLDLYNQVSAGDLARTAEGRLAVETDLDAGDIHLAKIQKVINVDLIRQAGLKVVVDTCCGAGAIITRKLLEILGVQYQQINSQPDIEQCNRGLEPTAENIAQSLGAKVKEFQADIGFAQDPDADRLAIVDETGQAIGEDYTLCLAAEYLLRLRQQGRLPGQNKICTNLSTTRIIDDIAQKYGAEVVRTKIGEVNVSLAMQKTKAVGGGEGNGGIILPSIGYGRDSLGGIALLLQYLAESGQSVSELVKGNPRYVMHKTKIDCVSAPQAADILEKIKSRYAAEKLDTQDGVKVIFADGNWLHVRQSNTEPIIRIIAEAETLAKARELSEQVKTA
ncbi:phosphoglucosamine mutase [Candidatus Termititenax persephonae]|uniref:Phosphoglucosamine mutase n=1 Tax=Candidatus Termititenax persephonae TaxID=2218525 RepID=A0A388TH05_9BACT|nr:phosphoglucosamine mutase [Candidatus Termititenax persephonae]